MFKTMHKHSSLLFFAAISLLVAACGRGPEEPGLEFAPAMYHSIPYEPYTQILGQDDRDNGVLLDQFKYGNTMPDYINNQESNLLLPAKNTIPRTVHYNDYVHTSISDDIMQYNLDPLNPQEAIENLKSPIPATEEVLDDGKVLFNQFCQHCHGKQGKGDGKVAAMYPGVPAQYKSTLTEGQIFHVITYGQGRMWPHGTQITPTDRWKIVRYVQSLQSK